jgi:hypothetical protein
MSCPSCDNKVDAGEGVFCLGTDDFECCTKHGAICLWCANSAFKRSQEERLAKNVPEGEGTVLCPHCGAQWLELIFGEGAFVVALTDINVDDNLGELIETADFSQAKCERDARIAAIVIKYCRKSFMCSL